MTVRRKYDSIKVIETEERKGKTGIDGGYL